MLKDFLDETFADRPSLIEKFYSLKCSVPTVSDSTGKTRVKRNDKYNNVINTSTTVTKNYTKPNGEKITALPAHTEFQQSMSMSMNKSQHFATVSLYFVYFLITVLCNICVVKMCLCH